MGVFSRAVAHWESGGYGAFLSIPAAQPGLLAAIMPDWRFGCLKETMLDLQDASLVRKQRHADRPLSQVGATAGACPSLTAFPVCLAHCTAIFEGAASSRSCRSCIVC
jgi:hypothetical protein